mgnify:CR=1 FL=1
MTDILNLYLPYFGSPCLNLHNRHYSTSGLPMLSSEKYLLFCKILFLWMKIAFYIYNDVGCQNDQKSTFSLHWWLWRFWWWRSICRQTYPNHTKKKLWKVCLKLEIIPTTEPNSVLKLIWASFAGSNQL